MCGITGLFNFTDQTVDPSLLKKMNRLITHRGPDTEGYFQNAHVGLAMRRLKVIDLSTGDQPIHNEDKTLQIVFNGEIYNYRELRENLIKKGHKFLTNSDTEVILHQYEEEGEECVRSFNGMFAFAIYDSRDKSLFIARDHLGIKPLFYHQSDEAFVFGSEIKSVLPAPSVKAKLDYQSISHYLSLNYLPPPLTPIQNLYQLEPGYWMRVKRGGVQMQSFWEVPTDRIIVGSEDAAILEIRELLHKSVERRLISDVPLGAFLSGGLDSSVLVALMKEHKHETIKTFSVGFNESSYDETSYAREVSRHFGTEHYEIRCKPEDVIDVLPRMGWHVDNLLADQAALPLYMVSKLAREHVTVALSGDGGDEMFVGYPTFHANRYHDIYTKIPKFFRKNIIEKIVQAIPSSSDKVSFDYKAKKFVQAGDFSPDKAHYWWRTIFTDEEKEKIFSSDALRQIKNIDASALYTRYFKKAHKLDFQSQALFADLKVWLAGNNLYKVDSMSMAHSLEARVPFLDRELVEYVSRLPFNMKYKNNTLKYLLKKAIRGRLPDSIIYRKKAGWHIPLAVWFKGPLYDYIQTSLFERNEMFENLFEKSKVQQLLHEHKQGKYNHSFKIWSLLIFSQWTKHFKEFLI